MLRGAGRQFQLTIVDEPDQLDQIAGEMAQQAAAAGDGTINAVACQAVTHGCAFGVLPQGTFNYFGRTHGIPEALEEAVHALLRSNLHPVPASACIRSYSKSGNWTRNSSGAAGSWLRCRR